MKEINEIVDAVKSQTERFLFDKHTHGDLVEPEDIVYKCKDVEDMINTLLEIINILHKEIEKK